MVKYKVVFAQEHKGPSVQQCYRCEGRGLDAGEPTSRNTEIESRRGLGCLYRICGRRYSPGSEDQLLLSQQ